MAQVRSELDLKNFNPKRTEVSKMSAHVLVEGVLNGDRACETELVWSLLWKRSKSPVVVIIKDKKIDVHKASDAEIFLQACYLWLMAYKYLNKPKIFTTELA